MQNKEIWKSIPGYSRYEASNLGRLRSINYKNTTRTKVLKPGYRDGYLRAMLLSDYGEYRTLSVHRLIMLTFVGDSKFEVNHINGIKDDNRLSNLEYVSHSYNLLHAYELGLQTPSVGSKNGNSKLSEEQVLEIRKYVAEKKSNGHRYYGRKELALKYNVSENTIKELVINRTNRKKPWSHI